MSYNPTFSTAKKFNDASNPDYIEIKGIVKKIIFYNPDNDFSIIVLRKDDGEEIKCKGNFLVHEKDPIFLKGIMVYDSKYSEEQLKVETLSYYTPLTKEGLKNYLTKNPAFKGIGAVKAGYLSEYAENFENILFNTPEVFIQNCKCNDNDIEIMKDVITENQAMFVAATRLAGYGLSPNQITKLLKYHGNIIVGLIEENPYLLMEKVSGYGFKRCDKIALNKGIAKDFPPRIQAAITYCIDAIAQDGHCWIKQGDLKIEVMKLTNLQLQSEKVTEQIEFLIEKKNIVKDILVINGLQTEVIANSDIYSKEMYIVEKLNNGVYKTNSKKYLEIFNQHQEINQKGNRPLNQKQIEACLNSFNYNITLLTGYAGTGKTTSLRAVLTVFNQIGLTFELAAPTGKAARVMSKACGYPAQTIHKLLEYSQATGRFSRNKDNPLTCDVVILDEVSMLSTNLGYDLLQAIPFGRIRLMILGDHNQLPPVEQGNLLRDLINNKTLPTITLDQIMRNKGALQKNSKKILDGVLIRDGEEIETRKGLKDWYILDNFDSVEAIKEKIASSFLIGLPKFGYNSMKDIQVISPMKQQKSQLGTFHLNTFLQSKVQKHLYNVDVEPLKTIKKKKVENEVESDNDNEEIESYLKPKLYVHDRVINTRNNYEKELVNGEIGFVYDIYEKEDERGKLKQVVVIDFSTEKEEKIVEFENSEDGLGSIELAYALTVHKLQGSETPCAIVVCVKEHFRMLNRNLFYTGITRSQECGIIIGNSEGIKIAVNTKEIDKRRTFTKYYLKSLDYNKLEENYLSTTTNCIEKEIESTNSQITTFNNKSIEKEDENNLLLPNSKIINTENEDSKNTTINENIETIEIIAIVEEPKQQKIIQRENLATDTLRDLFPIWQEIKTEIHNNNNT